MKRILFFIIFALIFSFSTLPVYAEPITPEPTKVDEILPPGIATHKGADLPKGDFKKEIIPQAVKIILGLTGTISFGVFVYAGVMLIIAQGNEEEITKFKNILIWSAVGLAFIMASYAIVTGVMQLIFK